MGKYLFILITLLATTVSTANAQRVIVGQFVDANTGEVVPFANAYVKNTLYGTVSDFDGIFHIKVSAKTDSLWFNALGYHAYALPLSELSADTNLVRLTSLSYAINEITVSPNDLPRKLLRQVIKNKPRNDPQQYNRTAYEKYDRWQYAVNNVGEKNWILRGANDLMKLDEDSNRYLPVYFAETLSYNETQKKPMKYRTTILGDNIKGIDVFKQYEIGGYSSAMDNAISFYENNIKMFGVVFVSPIADNALHYYKFFVTDSTYISSLPNANDSVKVYTLRFVPKTKGNKCFEGYMDIETKHFSLLSIDATMPKYTNINFVKDVSINSTYQFVNDSLPFFGTSEMKFTVDYMPVNSDKPRLGIKCNYFNSQSKVTVNQPDSLVLSVKNLSYETIKEADYRHKSEEYWNENRHGELTATTQESNLTIDSLNNVGSVKMFNKLVKLALTGFYDVGKWEIGPYTEMFNTNKIEGLHLGFGLRNSAEISEHWMFMGVVGYGFKNTKPTYQLGIGYKFDSPFRRALNVNYHDRLVKIGENENILYLYENMLTTSETNIVAQLFKREKIDELMNEQQIRVKYEHEWRTGLSSKLTFNYRWQYSPEYYPFSRKGVPVETVRQQEIAFDTRLSFKEKFMDDGMQRIYMETDHPIYHLTIAAGRAEVDDDESFYARLHATMKHEVYIGQTELSYAAEAGYFFGKLPYSLLEMPRGNKTIGFYTYDFNLMNYLEFVNDKYLYIYADYFLNGRLLNAIPGCSKLGLREVLGFKLMFGGLDSKHRDLLDMPDKASALNGAYAEFNIGLDNIFRFFRVDAVVRATESAVGMPRFAFRAQFNLKL